MNDYRNELKERILEYSEKEFYANGVKQVKMDNIANYLSISKRTLYEIYPTKEDLLLECLKKHDTAYESRIEQYIEDLNSAALFLVRYFYILKWHFWDLSIDMGIFWGSWFLHNHEIPHPNQWGSMITTKKYCLFNEDFSVVGFICI